jgi:hypothetical protein
VFTGTLLYAMITTSLILQAPTIPDRVSAKGGKAVKIGVHVDTRGLSIDELAGTALLVVRGRLVPLQSQLSNDQRNIWTTYRLIPSVVILDRTKPPTSPGATEPLTVTLLGGTVSILGTTATMENTSRRQWADGVDLLLFLVKADDIGATGYRPVGSSSGMFEIERTGTLKSLRSHAPDKQDIDGASFDSVVSAIAGASKRGDR